MKNMTAKALSLAICVCLAAGAVFCALTGTAPKEVAAERTIETVEEEIKACEALISRLNSELAVLEEQIAQTDGETASTLEQAQLLAAQVAVLETQIELNESLLISCDMKRATAQAELLLVQDEYDYYNELFSELMRFIYENGATNEFELLFSSESLTDYLSRRDNFNSVMESVNDLRLSMEQSLLRLTELNDEYEQVSAQYASHLQTLENDKAALSDSLAELDALTAELGIQSEALAGAYAELSKNITEAKEKLSALRRTAKAEVDAAGKRDKKSLQQQYDDRIACIENMLTVAKEANWLYEKFGDGIYTNVLGLCKLVTIAEIEEKGWSLTPGAYVGIAPLEDDGVDFSERMAEIHRELLSLQAASNDLMDTISQNMREMGI